MIIQVLVRIFLNIILSLKKQVTSIVSFELDHLPAAAPCVFREAIYQRR